MTIVSFFIFSYTNDLRLSATVRLNSFQFVYEKRFLGVLIRTLNTYWGTYKNYI
jgi:hypothetical protein